MVLIKAYAERPPMYVPDVGEVLYARRAPVEPWVKAVVLGVRRLKAGRVRLKVQWIESDPQAGVPDDDCVAVPIVAGDVGWVLMKEGAPLLAKQVHRDAPPV